MYVDILGVAQSIRKHSATDAAPIPLGHAQQLAAAAMGFKTLAAYQAARVAGVAPQMSGIGGAAALNSPLLINRALELEVKTPTSRLQELLQIALKEHRGPANACGERRAIVKTTLGPCYEALIGGRAWSLVAAHTGPELWVSGEGLAHERVCRLGMFQVLRRGRVAGGGADGAWSITNFGSYHAYSLDFLSDDDCKALSASFGIPFQEGGMLRKQQELSEATFLRSPAFAALRAHIRLRGVMPAVDDWVYGLTQVWTVLVALSDENFELMKHALADLLFPGRTMSPETRERWRAACATIEEHWPRLRSGSNECQAELVSFLPLRFQRLVQVGCPAVPDAMQPFANLAATAPVPG